MQVDSFSVDDKKLVIIAGGTRCGSTSLFRYLSDHPDVCRSVRKETRFFLDNDYPGRSQFRYEKGLPDFWSYFSESTAECTHLLEATPDYMYAPGVPDRIKAMVGCPEIIFILRNPVTRFLSWYRFAAQKGMIPADMGVDEFLDEQQPDSGSTPQHLRVLEQGQYPRYVSRFLSVFPRQNLHFIWFEELVRDPMRVVKGLVENIGLRADFYSQYEFGRENPSLKTRWPSFHRRFENLLFAMKTRLHGRPRLRKFIRSVYQPMFKPAYDSVMIRAQDPSERAAETEALEADLSALRDYYSNVEAELAELLNDRPPWTLSVRS